MATMAQRHGDEIARMAAEGMTQREIAARLGTYAPTICRIMKNLGVKPGGVQGRRVDPETLEKARLMTALYRDGYTLQQIGDLYGVTRERVRQILYEHSDVTAAEGGSSARAAKSNARKSEQAEARCYARNGCSRAQLSELRRVAQEMIAAGTSPDRTPIRAFAHQRCSARYRGIEWKLTLWEWWSIWVRSGKWEQRGRGQGYVMARNGDTGPYAIGNVYITTAIDNCSNSPAKRSNDLPTGVTRKLSNKTNPYTASRMYGGRKYYIGSFPSPELAHAAYLTFEPPVENRAA